MKDVLLCMYQNVIQLNIKKNLNSEECVIDWRFENRQLSKISSFDFLVFSPFFPSQLFSSSHLAYDRSPKVSRFLWVRKKFRTKSNQTLLSNGVTQTSDVFWIHKKTCVLSFHVTVFTFLFNCWHFFTSFFSRHLFIACKF